MMDQGRFYHESEVPLPAREEMEALQIFVNKLGLFQCIYCRATWFPEQGLDCPNPLCRRYYVPGQGYRWPAGGQAEAMARKGNVPFFCLGSRLKSRDRP